MQNIWRTGDKITVQDQAEENLFKPQLQYSSNISAEQAAKMNESVNIEDMSMNIAIEDHIYKWQSSRGLDSW